MCKSDEAFPDADLIIACDGLNSRIRTKYAATYQPDIDTRRCRFVWLGTHKLFEAFTFAFEETEHGWFQAHAYRYDNETSTFIVETPEDVWLKAGLDKMEKEEAIAFCEKLFAKYLDGHKLMSNATHLRGSAQWIKFPRVVCNTWVHHRRRRRQAPVVLMGDAAHTAHFSIGSGTKLALEDCDRAGALHRQATAATSPPRCSDYEAVRSIEVLRIQNAARNSTEWFENVARYVNLPPAAVRVFAADAQPAHQPREPAAARQGLRRAVRRLDRRARRRAARGRRRPRSRRCSRRSRCAA